ncbi:MAG: bifunctional tetrahydrofolate synthase/dihydrofolate synthase, partial [Pseudohongiella sp.]
MIDRTLDDWLDHISSVHPYEIELGLERIGLVANRLDISRPAPNVVSVAGTNGKGSCVAFMEGVLEHAGYRIGVFSSPHIH